jgi:hypothetical protein
LLFCGDDLGMGLGVRPKFKFSPGLFSCCDMALEMGRWVLFGRGAVSDSSIVCFQCGLSIALFHHEYLVI